MTRLTDELRNRIAELETAMRARIERMPKPVEDMTEAERIVARVEAKMESDHRQFEDRINEALSAANKAKHEREFWEQAQHDSQTALWRMLNAVDKALGHTGLVTVKNPERGLWKLQKKYEKLQSEFWRVRAKKNLLQDRLYDMQRAEGSPTAADIREALRLERDRMWAKPHAGGGDA